MDWKDPDALATAAFRVAPLPTQGEIEAKLTEALSMPGPYRLRWEGPAPATDPGLPPLTSGGTWPIFYR